MIEQKLISTFLLVKDAGGERKISIANDREYIVGRSATVDIPLNDQKASRKHAKVRVLNKALHVIDCDSLNGTYFGENRITEKALNSGEAVTIGSSTLSYIYSETNDVLQSSKHLNKLRERPAWLIPVVFAAVVMVIFGVLGTYLHFSKKSNQKPEEILSAKPSNISISGQLIDEKTYATGPIKQTKNMEKAKECYRLGLLFYDAGHLKKAIDQWDLALAYDEQNDLALAKLKKAIQELDEEIASHYQAAKAHYQYLRFHEARQEFMIVTELSRDKSDERYLDAKEKLEKLKEENR